MAATTTAKNRVAANTAAPVNRQIKRRTDDTISYHARHRDAIDGRLDELDREGDIERWLQANAATLLLAGLGLSTFGSRKWLVLPGLVGTFLLQHALQGWCPPVPLLRRLGVRTQEEIDRARYSLRALRGDFDQIGDRQDAAPYLRARYVRKLMQ